MIVVCAILSTLGPVVYPGRQTLNVDIVEFEDAAVMHFVIGIVVKGEHIVVR